MLGWECSPIISLDEVFRKKGTKQTTKEASGEEPRIKDLEVANTNNIHGNEKA